MTDVNILAFPPLRRSLTNRVGAEFPEGKRNKNACGPEFVTDRLRRRFCFIQVRKTRTIHQFREEADSSSRDSSKKWDTSDEFLVDLYAMDFDASGVLTTENKPLTA